MIDLKSIRQDFPLLSNHPDLAYLDNAATTQKPSAVITAILDYYENSNANVHRGIYQLSETSTRLYEQARTTVAAFLNADSEQIVFSAGTTASLNQLALSLEPTLSAGGNPILVSELEHHSNFLPWQKLSEKLNLKLDFIPVETNLEIDLTKLNDQIKLLQPQLLTLTHISNVTGTIQPLDDIIAIVRKHSPETIIVIDAAQSVAHYPINFNALNADFLVFSGHKIYAETGIGVLVMQKKYIESLQPAFRGGGMVCKVDKDKSSWAEGPEKFEAGTPHISGAISLAAAINYLNNIGLDNIRNYEDQLSDYAYEQLTAVPDLQILAPKNRNARSCVFSLALPRLHPHDLAHILSQENVAVRAGHHCCQILMRYVLKKAATTRASLAVYNTKEDIDKLVAAINIARKLLD